MGVYYTTMLGASMSAGSQVIPLRIPAELLARMDAAIASANAGRHEEEYTRSTWMRAAIEARLAHVERARKQKVTRRARKAGAAIPVIGGEG